MLAVLRRWTKLLDWESLIYKSLLRKSFDWSQLLNHFRPKIIGQRVLGLPIQSRKVTWANDQKDENVNDVEQFKEQHQHDQLTVKKCYCNKNFASAPLKDLLDCCSEHGFCVCVCVCSDESLTAERTAGRSAVRSIRNEVSEEQSFNINCFGSGHIYAVINKILLVVLR